MTIAPGTPLGRYEIRSQVGGSMCPGRLSVYLTTICQRPLGFSQTFAMHNWRVNVRSLERCFGCHAIAASDYL